MACARPEPFGKPAIILQTPRTAPCAAPARLASRSLAPSRGAKYIRMGRDGNKCAPGGTRTPDRRLRRPVLYPAELRAQERPEPCGPVAAGRYHRGAGDPKIAEAGGFVEIRRPARVRQGLPQTTWTHRDLADRPNEAGKSNRRLTGLLTTERCGSGSKPSIPARRSSRPPRTSVSSARR